MITYKQLTDFGIHATDGDIGSCKDILFDDQDYVVRYFVADTSWLPLSRKVVISPISLTKVDEKDETLHVNMTQQGLKDSPSIDEHKPLSRDYEETLFKYFGYGYYWVGPGAWGDFAHPTELADPDMQPSVEEIDNKPTNHLRSCSEVHGYDVDAKGEGAGHITDFVIDTDNWAIKLFIVDTHNWLPGGKKIALVPTDIDQIDWSTHKVLINVDHETLTERPEIDMDRVDDVVYIEEVTSQSGGQ